MVKLALSRRGYTVALKFGDHNDACCRECGGDWRDCAWPYRKGKRWAQFCEKCRTETAYDLVHGHVEQPVPRSFVLKPAGVNTHAIYHNGIQIGQLRFGRFRDRVRGIHTEGRLTLSDGRSMDLGGYSYFRDIKRDLPDLITVLHDMLSMG